MLSADAKQMILDWPLGFVASADADGSPNLSPKGTFLTIDDRTIAFAEMRSPQTARNIEGRADVAVNFIDILTRRGLAISGTARMAKKGDGEYRRLVPRFEAIWGAELEALFNGIVVIDLTACREIQSPAYEAGATESALREDWMAKISAVHDRQRSATKAAS